MEHSVPEKCGPDRHGLIGTPIQPLNGVLWSAIIFVYHEVVSEQLKGLGLTRAQEVQDSGEEDDSRLHAASQP